MMKKSVLFIIPSLKSGGAEKSLVTLLSLFDYDKYDVDLLVFRNEGLFSSLVPPQVKVIDGSDSYKMFDGSIKASLGYFISRGRLITAAKRVRYAFVLKGGESKKVYERSWNILKSILPHPVKQYDAAVGYLEGNPICFCADGVNAAKRIGWLHTDVDRIAHRVKADEPYIKKLDTLVCVSDKCCRKAESAMPFLNGKTVTIENIVSKKLICEMAGESDVYDRSGSEKIILTVGRLSEPKGIDNAVLACALLLKRGCNIKWYHIGIGELHDEICSLITKEKLEDRFILLGERSNPYPYIKYCDIYVQPSRFEGKSIAIDEAKCLEKPIVATRFPTVTDQITDGEDGITAEISPQDIADKAELLLNDDKLCRKLSATLHSSAVGNEDEINKLYALIEG